MMKISLIGRSRANMLDTPVLISDFQWFQTRLFRFVFSWAFFSCHSESSADDEWSSRTRSVRDWSFPHLRWTVCQYLDMFLGASSWLGRPPTQLRNFGHIWWDNRLGGYRGSLRGDCLSIDLWVPTISALTSAIWPPPRTLTPPSDTHHPTALTSPIWPPPGP